MIAGLDYFRELNFESLCIRLLLAVILPVALGFERERHHHDSAMSTYAIVTIGAALTMIIGQYEANLFLGSFGELAGNFGVKTDVSRLGAQVINGVGFLGAGTIIVTGERDIKGLTTAAGLWSSACMGLAIGVGFYECVIIAFVLMFITMRILNDLQENLLRHSCNMHIYTEVADVGAIKEVIRSLRKIQVNIKNIDISKSHMVVGDESGRLVGATLILRIPKGESQDRILSMISDIDSVITVENL